ncbi:hypothetical protein [Nocardioides humi]|uniref:Uncharacterized protein n=1 Tax=Nocardioides humi TaxID=449461 RepID=A0ABN2BLU3_9ACTN|nr:hypothetical protein [Nocardioides humi]
MTVALPCVVWVDISGGAQHGPDPWLGLLLEWRQTADRQGNAYWEGLVAIARGGGVYIRPSVSVEWMRAEYLTPVEVARLPRHRDRPAGR